MICTQKAHKRNFILVKTALRGIWALFFVPRDMRTSFLPREIRTFFSQGRRTYFFSQGIWELTFFSQGIRALISFSPGIRARIFSPGIWALVFSLPVDINSYFLLVKGVLFLFSRAAAEKMIFSHGVCWKCLKYTPKVYVWTINRHFPVGSNTKITIFQEKMWNFKNWLFFAHIKCYK